LLCNQSGFFFSSLPSPLASSSPPSFSSKTGWKIEAFFFFLPVQAIFVLINCICTDHMCVYVFVLVKYTHFTLQNYQFKCTFYFIFSHVQHNFSSFCKNINK
jgi:hypothetical protein